MPTRLPDPFAIQTDPRLYVPRRATEEALDALERAVSLPHAVVSFTGPPGLGKTLLLRVLAAELAPRFRTAYLPYARLPSGGVWTWAARELALEPEDDAKEALRRVAGELEGEGRALLLEIDDASSLPAETLAELTAFARDEPGLRLVLAFSEDERLAEPPPEGAAVVRLEQPMTRAETQDYVKGRLARSAAPRDVAQRFDTATVARLHRESEGNPLRVHALADDVVRAPAQVAAAPERKPVAEPRAKSEPIVEPHGSEPIVESHGSEPIVESHGSEPIAALRAKYEPAAEPRAESVTAPPELVQRAETAPAALGPETAAALSQRAKRAAPAKRPDAHRSRAGTSRDSRRRLGRLLAGAAGLCVGLVAGVGAERWVTGRFAPPSATKPAPAVSSPPFASPPAPAPSGAIAAPPQMAPPAPAAAAPGAAEPPQAAAPPTAAESPPPAASSPQLAAPPTTAGSPQGAATLATPPPTPATVPPAATPPAAAAPATADSPQGAAPPQPAVPGAAADLPQAPAPQLGAAPPPTAPPSAAAPPPTAAPPQAAAPPSAPASPASPGASVPPALVAPPPVAATPRSAPAPPAPSAAATGSVAAPPPAAVPAPVPQPSPGAAVPPGRSEPAAPESRRTAPPPPQVEAPWALGRLAVEADAPVLVEIDGQPFGTTPLSDVRLRRGLHRVVAHYRDGGVGQKTVYLGDEDVLVTFR